MIEAIIAGPIFAVAHAHPDGDDTTGKSGPGWMMILSLLCRPALMIFGLMTAMLLTEPIVGFINTAYMTVVAGVQADSFTGIVGFLAYVYIYVLITIGVVHTVFSLIHWVPDNILRWIGGATGGMHSAQQAGESTQGRFESSIQNVRQHAGLGSDGPSPSGSGDAPPSISTSDKGLPDEKDLFPDR